MFFKRGASLVVTLAWLILHVGRSEAKQLLRLREKRRQRQDPVIRGRFTKVQSVVE